MKTSQFVASAAVILAGWLGLSANRAARAAEGEIPAELTTPNYRVSELTGIGRQKGVERQDPSNVLKAGDTYYVWYTRRKAGVHPYASTVFYATSSDGRKWVEKGQAVGKGQEGQWDSFGVITPYTAAVGGKYYLYYTGTSAPKGFRSRDPGGTLRHIGVAIADSPDGPWRKFEGNPVLSPTPKAWDSLIVDDAHLLVWKGKCWLYYKGGHGTIPPSRTQWGLAVGEKPTGPFVKSKHNPLIGGHTVCVWPHRRGLAALIDAAGTERFTVQWSTDGIRFRRAAKLKVVHTGCGPYDPDAHGGVAYGRGIMWGVAQAGRPLRIVRFDVALGAPRLEGNSLRKGTSRTGKAPERPKD